MPPTLLLAAVLLPTLALAKDGTYGARLPDFVVEDDSLLAAPPAVSALLSGRATDVHDKPCRFVGKQVAISDGGPALDWVLTTAGACGWAASSGPIFVVRSVDGHYQVVLESMGYDFTIGKKISHGMRNLAIARATATVSELDVFEFDGSEYKQTLHLED